MSAAADLLMGAKCLWVDAVTADVTRQFARHGVHSILMKGPVFAEKLYRDGAIRPYGDSDLLVAPWDYKRAESILKGMGFWNELGPLAHPRMEAQHWIRSDSAFVDLHCTLWGLGVEPALVWEELSARTESQSVGGSEVRVLSSVPCAMHAALHAAHHGKASRRTLDDLARALVAFDETTWSEAGLLVRRLGAAGPFATGLRLVEGGADLVERLGLGDARSVDALLQIAPVPLSQGIEELKRTRGLRAKARLLAREAFPTTAFMHWWSPRARRGRVGLASAYAWRLVYLAQHTRPAIRAWSEARREAAFVPRANGTATAASTTEGAAALNAGVGATNGSTLRVEAAPRPLTAVDHHRLVKERDFHDALAAELDLAALLAYAPDHLERGLFDRLGPLEGLQVLDLGCGKGDLSLELLARGAKVTALDISPGMVEITRRRAKAFHPDRELGTRVGPVEAMPLADQSFDLVVGKWIIHHVDVEDAAREVRRILRPGGLGIFIENSGLNPLLSVARRRLAGRFGIPRFGTEDEHPLVKRDYAALESYFADVRLHFPDFCFFALCDRQIFRFRWARVTKAVRWLDDFIWRRLPPLRRYSFHVIVEMEKE